MITQHVQQETALLNISQLIRSTLGLTTADTEYCLALMSEFRQLKLTPVMLIKNPGCVDMIKRMRRYVGNEKQWNLTEAEREEFVGNALKIRTMAGEIYKQFKKLFVFPEDMPFYPTFASLVEIFHDKIKDLDQEQTIRLVEMPEEIKPFLPGFQSEKVR